MNRETLIHDTASAAAAHLLECTKSVVPESDREAMHTLFYCIVSGAIEAMDQMQAQEDMRLINQIGNN